MSHYEVIVEANEPWTPFVRQAHDSAILEFIKSNLSGNERAEYCGTPAFDVDAQLTARCGDEYRGFGPNAHPDADGFVFTNGDSAQSLADTLYSHLKGSGATVRIFQLD